MAVMRLSLFLLAAVVFATPHYAGTRNPNVVFIMADDLGWNDVGYHGSEIQTPNIDRLAATGVRLDRYYAFPSCSPTRTALMTGRSPLLRGTTGFGGALPSDVPILPEVLRTAGYQTFMVGKWHLGSRHVNQFPHNRGFDHFYGFLRGTVDSFSHLWIGALDWQRNGHSVPEEGYTTDLLTDEAIRLIADRDPDRPFFLYVAFNAPHYPLVAPDSLIEKYSHIPDKARRVYAAMVDSLDQAVGRIVAAIDESGTRSNSLLVWVSDNGGATRMGGHNSPLRGGKGTSDEGGMRVPGLMNWPGKLAEGETLSQMITVQDWLPTLISATEIDWTPSKPIDGQDMWNAITNREVVERRDVVLGSNRRRALYRDNWKLVEGGFRRAENPAPPTLYDIVADPSEETDLASDHPDVVAELTAALDDISERFPQPSRAGRGRFRPRPGPRADGPRRAGGGPGVGEGPRAGFGPRAGGGRREGSGGRTRPDPFRRFTEETRPPVAEAAARD